MGQTCSQTCSFRQAGRPDGGAAPAPAGPQRGAPRGEEDEPLLPFHVAAFQVSVVQPASTVSDGLTAALQQVPDPRQLVAGSVAGLGGGGGSSSSTKPRCGWRSSYKLGPLLGDGISAKVFQAEAVLPGFEGQGDVAAGGAIWETCSGIGMPQCLRERGRRVAIKRFHRPNSKTYQKELDALRRVGVFPHILRLLESYQGFEGEDVLVLEYCDGSTLYDLYAREHANGGLPEKLVARFIRQLLLALQHLGDCGVEHQDVKPENMMLHDVSVSSCQGELKLGDFGWAAMAPPPGTARPRLPVTGAGSLWYAPPELNPPVEGVPPCGAAMPTDEKGNVVVGRSDMWSVGVVLYLLLVGHNPFNLALRQGTPEAVDTEVLRLAALGQFNKYTERWLSLDMDARDFVSVLLRIRPLARPTAVEALQHPFLMRRVAKSYESSIFFHGSISSWTDREESWKRLDGFQRLAWLAVARGVAEPELDRSVVASALEGAGAGGATPASRSREATYLWQLARELATTPVFQWLQDRGAWPDILRVAFAYLDLDGDGLLSPPDLAGHVARPAPPRGSTPGDPTYERMVITANTTAWAQACRWVARWQDPHASQPALTARGHPGLEIESFREALLCSRGVDDAIIGGFEAPVSTRSPGGGIVTGVGNSGLKQAEAAEGYGRRPCNEEEEISWGDMAMAGQASGV